MRAESSGSNFLATHSVSIADIILMLLLALRRPGYYRYFRKLHLPRVRSLNSVNFVLQSQMKLLCFAPEWADKLCNRCLYDVRGNFIKLHFQTIQFHALLSSTCFPSGINLVKGRQPGIAMCLTLSSFVSLSLSQTKCRQFILNANGQLPYAYPICMACICRMRLLLLHSNRFESCCICSTSVCAQGASWKSAEAEAEAEAARHLCVDTSKMKVQSVLWVYL